MTVTCYTDASHNQYKDIAACGYCVLLEGKIVKHEVVLVEGLGSAGHGEVFAITKALQYAFLLKGVTGIIINTDYLPIITAKNKNKKIISQEFNETIDIIKEHDIWIRIKYVAAHQNSRLNNMIDESCRKQLRKVVGNTHNGGKRIPSHCFKQKK